MLNSNLAKAAVLWSAFTASAADSKAQTPVHGEQQQSVLSSNPLFVPQQSYVTLPQSVFSESPIKFTSTGLPSSVNYGVDEFGMDTSALLRGLSIRAMPDAREESVVAG